MIAAGTTVFSDVELNQKSWLPCHTDDALQPDGCSATKIARFFQRFDQLEKGETCLTISHSPFNNDEESLKVFCGNSNPLLQRICDISRCR